VYTRWPPGSAPGGAPGGEAGGGQDDPLGGSAVGRAAVLAVGRSAVFAVVDAAFAQRRKTLRSALAAWAGSAQAAEKVLREAGVDPSLRGEAIGVAQYIQIAEAAAKARTIIES
jgi:hypothetical protein